MATKNMIVRIGADLSDLKGKTQQAKSLFEKMTTVRSSAAKNRKNDLAKELERARAEVAGLEGDYKRLTAAGGMQKEDNAAVRQLKQVESARKALDKAWTNKNGTLKANTPDGILGQYEALERQADALNARIAQIRLDPAGTEEAQSLAGRLGEAKERAGMLEKELAKAGRADKLEGVKAKLVAVTGHAGRAALSLAKMGAKNTVGKLGSAVGNVAGKIKGFAGGLAKAFGQVLKYRTACAVFESLSETMTGVAKSDSVLNANLGKIQGNLLTAFAPVINAILPMLRTLSSAIATVTAQFASMMAALFGTTVQAAASTASKVNAAATGASSKLKRSVMSFDKLNKVDSKDSGGGSGSSTGIDPTFSGEDVGVPPWMKKIQEGFKNLGEGCKALKENFLEAWNMDGVGDRITAAFGNIGNRLLDCWVNITGSIREWCENLDFSPLLNSFADLMEALEPVTDLLCGALEWAFDNVLLPFGKWTIEAALPAILEALAGALDLLVAVCNALKGPAQWVWDNFLQPLAAWTGSALILAVRAVGAAFEWLAGLISGDKEKMEKAAAHMSEAWENFKDKTVEVFGNMWSIIHSGYEAFEQWMLDKTTQLADDWIAKWNGLKESVSEAWNNIIGGIKQHWENFKNDPLKWGEDMLRTFAQGITNGAKWVIEKVKGIGSEIRSLLHFSVPDKGPLADADTWMPDMMQLMADGVQQKKKLLLQKMQGLAGEMSGQMNANLTGAVAASVQTAGNAGMPDNSAAIITVLENGFRVLRRAIEDKETSVQLDGETVSRSVTQRQNRRELMRGKAVTP